MFGTTLLLAAAAAVCWWAWRHDHPATRHPCPLCPELVRDVAAHLDAAHPDTPWTCHQCRRLIPADTKTAHWRLFHTPRPPGPEDRTTWKAGL